MPKAKAGQKATAPPYYTTVIRDRNAVKAALSTRRLDVECVGTASDKRMQPFLGGGKEAKGAAA